MCTKEQTSLVPLGHVFGSACTGLQLAVILCWADLMALLGGVRSSYGFWEL